MNSVDKHEKHHFIGAVTALVIMSRLHDSHMKPMK